MRLSAAFLVLIALAFTSGWSGHGRAEQAVDLELALGIDVSGSIDPEEAKLQREGYIAAFRDPEVIRAIKSGILGRIGVGYYEWAGFGHMKIIADWTLIEDEQDAHAFADALTRDPPMTARRTAVADAINFAVPYFDRNDFQGTRRVLDISGDGPNNWGARVTDARDDAVAAGVTINGLPIINDRASPFSWSTLPNLDLYYEHCVIGGPGAFIIVAKSFEDFATAVRKKLILEIAGRQPPKMPARARIVPAAGDDRTVPPCDIGERQWRRRHDY